MNDKELSGFGERLYEAILTTPLPGGTIAAIATAIRQGVPWDRLPPTLKIAIFKIAANCFPVADETTQPDGTPPMDEQGEDASSVSPVGRTEGGGGAAGRSAAAGTGSAGRSEAVSTAEGARDDDDA